MSGRRPSLVRALVALVALLEGLIGFAGARPGAAQEGPIADNSFLVEEAYNQEPRVVQHVTTFWRAGEAEEWSASFTQEWPAPSQRHQLSYTLAYVDQEAGRGLGDLALNYRFQWVGFGEDPIAIAPRVSLLLPTGDERRGRGLGAAGLQVNLPLSARLGARWVGHWNAGASWTPEAVASDGSERDVAGWNLAQGLVWLMAPRRNLLFEASWTSAESPGAGGAIEREEAFWLSPGARFAIDLASGLQIVPGIALPIGVGPSAGEWSVLLYLSLEHPF